MNYGLVSKAICSLLLVGRHQFDATVFGASDRGPVSCHEMGLAEALRNQLAGRNALVLQVGSNRFGAPLRQFQIVGSSADRVAVTVDVDLNVRIGLKRF